MAAKLANWRGLRKGSLRDYSMALVDVIESMLHPDPSWYLFFCICVFVFFYTDLHRRLLVAQIQNECTEERQSSLNFNSFGSM